MYNSEHIWAGNWSDIIKNDQQWTLPLDKYIQN